MSGADDNILDRTNELGAARDVQRLPHLPS